MLVYFCGHLVHFSTFWYLCLNKTNLATLSQAPTIPTTTMYCCCCTHLEPLLPLRPLSTDVYEEEWHVLDLQRKLFNALGRPPAVQNVLNQKVCFHQFEILLAFAFFVVANLYRINCPIVRNSESDRHGILFYSRCGTPLQEWCRRNLLF
jgi:hypothetical protein